jgi:dephospho-CoA kinase
VAGLAFRQQAFRVGLTGGIASGKTQAADAFERAGAVVIDTDRLAREVVAPGSPGLAQIAEAFGAGVLTPAGQLDRAAMRRRIFADPDARRTLEAITHPLIRAALVAESDQRGGPYQILVVPLLIEGGLDASCDRVLVIDAAEEIQKERLMRRDGSDEATARGILAAQSGRADRLARADDVIVNEGSLEALEACVWRLDRYYRELAGMPDKTTARAAPGLRLPDPPDA